MFNNYKKFLFLLLIFCSFPCFSEQLASQKNSEDSNEINIVGNNTGSGFFRKDIILPTHNIYATTGLGTINSDNFWGNIKLNTGYLNYKFYPFYVGGGLGFDIGIASNNFPFHLKVDGVDTGFPLMLNFSPMAIGGIHYLFEKPDILAFFELQLGLNIRYLASSNILYPYAGNATPSFFADFGLGAQWKYLRASFNVQLDSAFIYSIGGTIGVILNLPTK